MAYWVSLLYILGPVVAKIVQRTSSKFAVVVGGFLLSGGLILVAYIRHIGAIYAGLTMAGMLRSKSRLED